MLVGSQKFETCPCRGANSNPLVNKLHRCRKLLMGMRFAASKVVFGLPRLPFSNSVFLRSQGSVSFALNALSLEGPVAGQKPSGQKPRCAISVLGYTEVAAPTTYIKWSGY